MLYFQWYYRLQIYEKQISVKLFCGNNSCMPQQMPLKFPQYYFYIYLCDNLTCETIVGVLYCVKQQT